MPLHIPLLCQSRHHVEHKRHCGIGMGYYDYEDEETMPKQNKGNGPMSKKKTHSKKTEHDSSSSEDKSPSRNDTNEYNSSRKVHGFRPSISFIREARAAKPPKLPNHQQRHHHHPPPTRHSIEVLARLSKDLNTRISVDKSARSPRYSVDNGCMIRHSSRPSSTGAPVSATIKVKPHHSHQKHSKMPRSSQPSARNDSYTQFLVGAGDSMPNA